MYLLINRMSLETSIKIPHGISPVTGENYFPASFNCIKHIHELSKTTDKSKATKTFTIVYNENHQKIRIYRYNYFKMLASSIVQSRLGTFRLMKIENFGMMIHSFATLHRQCTSLD